MIDFLVFAARVRGMAEGRIGERVAEMVRVCGWTPRSTSASAS